MESNELQFLFSLFSFVGVIGILFYNVIVKTKIENLEETVEILEHKVESLQDYIYELEERLESNKTPAQDEIKKRIIEMYEEGKEILLIENTLDIPRAKIEMVLKFHKLQVER
jgi:predicted RNase H-like nuclease (RuvC/YqgF family)